MTEGRGTFPVLLRCALAGAVICCGSGVTAGGLPLGQKATAPASESGAKARSIHSATLTDKDTVLLGEFQNQTGDEVFDGWPEQALRTAFEESPFLSVVPAASAAAAAREISKAPNASLTPELSRQVCRREHCKAYVTGSIRRNGAGFVISLQAADATSGNALAVAQVNATEQNRVVDALGQAAAKLRVKTGESSAGVRQFSTPLSRATSNSFEALRAWAAAIRAQRESADLASGSEAAIPLLEKAVHQDPKFAGAIFAIGLIYRDSLQEARAREYLIRAFEMRERASVREKFRSAGMYYSFVTVESDKAVRTYQQWIKAYPRDFSAVSNLGSFYGDICRYQDSIAEFLRARRMNPGNVIPHEDLIEILTATGQFAEAHEAYREMQRMKLDDDSPHVFMYAVAFLEHDERAMKQQAAWFDGKPQLQHEILSEEADAEAYGGHLARARELTKEAVEAAVRADNKEQAAAWQLNSAWREEFFGNREEARQQTYRALEIAPESREESAVAAILLARTGDAAKARAIADELAQRYAVHAVVQSYWLPCIRAQISLAENDPKAALQQLKKARQYDTLFPQVAFYSPMLSVVLRAEAYTALRQPAAAAREWNKISQYPGIVQLSAVAPFARLRFARASAAASSPNARRLYKEFLTLWNDAEPDIPILREAQAGLGALK